MKHFPFTVFNKGGKPYIRVQYRGEDKEFTAMNPHNTVFDAKRLIGRKFDDPEVQADMKHFPFTVFNKGGKPYIRVQYRGEDNEFSPEEISSMVLLKMKETAEAYLGTTVTNAVVTVPAYFNDSQRQATKDAGTISGLNVLRIINEPTAAAIAYGLDKKVQGERNVLIFDLGGGTFDVSLLTIEEGIFEVKGSRPLPVTLTWVVRTSTTVLSTTSSRSSSASTRRISPPTLVPSVVSAPLASMPSVSFLSLLLRFISKSTLDFNTSLTRARFGELCQDLFRSTLQLVEKVLRDSKINKSNVHEIVLVGGSTRIPRIAKLVSDFFNGKEPNKSINPDEAVAHGASVHAAILSGDTSEKTQDLLLDVAPLPRDPISSQPTPTINPASPSKPTRVSVPASRTTASSATSSSLASPPPPLRGVPQIEVTFDIDANGSLNVSRAGQDHRQVEPHHDHQRQGPSVEKRRSTEWSPKPRSTSRMPSTLGTFDDKFAVVFDAGAQEKLKSAVDGAIQRLDSSQEASKDEYEYEAEGAGVHRLAHHVARSYGRAMGLPSVRLVFSCAGTHVKEIG
ncbi:hypothetical protein NMY22_g13614 [Coprinellus aureogranulatus]|nr:hypothetical protein NMY22_g13614 [Coprinellus aureogranulatus]